MTTSPLADNLALLQERIARAVERVGRHQNEISLLAVTKMQPPERIREAYEAGLRLFGENYVQEARAKLSEPLLDLPDLQWHFIGHLQSNKAREVVGCFSLLQSIDSLDLAKEVAKRARQRETVQPILLEVKLDTTAPKFGVAPQEVLPLVESLMELPNVRLEGLMGMAPFGTDATAVRASFRTLARCFEKLPPEARKVLSMGMSGDFEVAIEEGSTMIRIGTSLFGARPLKR